MWSDLESRLRGKLDPLDRLTARVRGDSDLNPDWTERPPALRAAAVLAPIVRRPQGWTLLFTERAHDLPMHPGQISFPGGRIEAHDPDPLAAALRETEEEIGLSRALIEPIGAWERYETGSGFSITPIAAFVAPEFSLSLDPREVAGVFEAPLSFLLDPANHERREGEWRGRRGAFYAMPYGERFIWGATAGMIRALYERLYS